MSTRNTRKLDKLLVANRGEIAVRIIRACRELGIRTVAVYSEPDTGSMHRRLADESYLIGPAAAVESYLSIERIIEALERSGADAVHPGYGFLAENAEFARAVERAGATWVGPSPDSMDLMGSKVSAKRLAEEAEVPIVPGFSGETTPEELAAEAEKIGYPVLVKASAGGGGRGMRMVERPEDFLEAFESATREAEAAFGEGTVFLEKAVVDPRHIEVQIIADDHGKVVHLGERDCSIQRRHQKVVEEAPSPAITEEFRRELGAAAVRLAKAAGYRNAGTVEFLLSGEESSGEEFHFLEMNTRLQVEHPVTELVTGLDLLHLQLTVAAGEPLPVTQDEVSVRGSAIEVRLYAEDPQTAMPSEGELLLFEPPEGPGIRNDTGVETGDSVPLDYDPMLAKLIVHAPDRPAAVARLRQALKEYLALGVTTNLPLLRQIADHGAFGAGDFSTGFLEAHGLTTPSEVETPPEVLVAAAVGELSEPSEVSDVLGERPSTPDPFAAGRARPGGGHRLRYRLGETEWEVRAERGSRGRWMLEIDGNNDHKKEVEIVARRGGSSGSGGRLYLLNNGGQICCGVVQEGRDLLVGLDGYVYRLGRRRPLNLDDLGAGAGTSSGTSLTAPMPGTVIKVLVEEGTEVEAGRPILILEAMKTEQSIQAPYAGIVRKLPFEAGGRVAGGAILAEIDEAKEQSGE